MWVNFFCFAWQNSTFSILTQINWVETLIWMFVQPCLGCKSTFISHRMRSNLLRISNRYTCVKVYYLFVYVCIVFGFYYREKSCECICIARCHYVCKRNDIYEQNCTNPLFIVRWEQWAALKIHLWWLSCILSSWCIVIINKSPVMKKNEINRAANDCIISTAFDHHCLFEINKHWFIKNVYSRILCAGKKSPFHSYATNINKWLW